MTAVLSSLLHSKAVAPALVLLLLVLLWLAANVGPSREAASSGVRKYLPSVEVGFGSHASRYSRSKLAVIIEPRPLSHLSPLLLHTIQVVPPDWRFMLVGTDESVRHVNTSLGIRTHVASGKLEYRKMLLSANEISVHQKETASADVSEITNRVLTDTNFYGSVIGPAESLFIFNSNSVLCANSNYTLDDWLQYDWVTAPGVLHSPFSGNGGFSLRRVSLMQKILQEEIRRTPESESKWFTKRILGNHAYAKVADVQEQRAFIVESTWHPKPMGFHLPNGGVELPPEVWKSNDNWKSIYAYCPETKIIMPMKFERQICHSPAGN